MGPDDFGAGQTWTASGAWHDVVLITLQVKSGDITVRSLGTAMGDMAWRSDAGGSMTKYFVVASWNRWSLDEEMQADPGLSSVYRWRFEIGPKRREEFQIVVNRNWGVRFYPDSERARPGFAPACGPDGGG